MVGGGRRGIFYARFLQFPYQDEVARIPTGTFGMIERFLAANAALFNLRHR